MDGSRYHPEWTPARYYDNGYVRLPQPMRGRPRGYDAGMRGRGDRDWTEEMAYGRETGMGLNGPGMFTPFGWDPMLRWSGWDPLMGYVPYQDTPRQWSYGLAEDYERPDHDFYRGNVAHRYGRDYGGYDRPYRSRGGRMPPRGYGADYGFGPRRGPRR